MRRPRAGERDDHEEDDQTGTREGHEPEDEHGEGAADGAGSDGYPPRAAGLAMISATRSAGVTRLGALADQLVPLDLDDRHAREPAGLEAAAAEIDHTVDLRRLASGAALEGERRILARAVHEPVRDRPDQRLV